MRISPGDFNYGVHYYIIAGVAIYIAILISGKIKNDDLKKVVFILSSYQNYEYI